MSDAAMLLRMLEPTVRPVPTVSHTRGPARPIEDRGFEELLNEARENRPAAASQAASMDSPTDSLTPAPAPPPAPGLFTQGFDRIDNVSLRQMLAKAMTGSNDGGAV